MLGSTDFDEIALETLHFFVSLFAFRGLSGKIDFRIDQHGQINYLTTQFSRPNAAPRVRLKEEIKVTLDKSWHGIDMLLHRRHAVLSIEYHEGLIDDVKIIG